MITPARKNSALIPDVFNVFFGNDWTEPVRHLRESHRPASVEPAINIMENDGLYKVEMATPGMQKEDFSIKLNNEGELVVAVEKKEEAKSETTPAEADNAAAKANEVKEHYWRRDFSYAKFSQSFSLPEDVDLDAISARMADGVLTIELPKKKPAEPVDNTRYIEVM